MTQRESNLKKIRDACIANDPSIVELKFGCEIDINWNGAKANAVIFRTFINEGVDAVEERKNKVWSTGKNPKQPQITEIISRPIGLADVLLAIGKTAEDGDFRYVIDSQGRFASYIPEYGQDAIVLSDIAWNLHENLSGQTDSTLEFISSLVA